MQSLSRKSFPAHPSRFIPYPFAFLLSRKPRCLFCSTRSGTSGTRWNKHRRFWVFWQNRWACPLAVRSGCALRQSLGLPFGSAVGLCPTVPLLIDRSEAACRRQALSLLRSFRVILRLSTYKHFAPNGAESRPHCMSRNK